MITSSLLWQILSTCLLIKSTVSQNTAFTNKFNDTGPLSTYKSRPDLQAPFLNITLHDDRHVTPGYIFLAPYQTNQDTVYMYDSRGNLVWSAFGSIGGGIYHNPHICSINGTDYLCTFSGNQFLGWARGHGTIIDSSLSIAGSVQVQGGLVPFDEHEFNIVDDGKFVLVTTYDPQQYDLTHYNITDGEGWIMDNYFQKINVATGELLFEWNAIDYVPVSDTYILPGSTDVSGDGLGPFSAYDWFHINAVDQNANGDYLVSARHVSTIYKVSGVDGSIIWQLGGKSSDFAFAPGLNFTFQHDARFRFENASTTIISVFDNAGNGYSQSSRYSSGMVIKVDHHSKRASLLRSYVAPYEFISNSQGNLQLLGPNTAWNSANTFCGWGSNAYISEYTNDGTMVLNGHFATTGTMNYRAYKFNFTTNPTDAPASYVYAHNTSAPTVFYMSWNGATRAAQWRIHTSNAKNGTFHPIATVAKRGFETIFTAPHYHPWSIIESVDANGKSLRNSTRPTRTFVPGPILATSCNESECPLASGFSTDTNGEGSAQTNTGSSNVMTKRDTNGVLIFNGISFRWPCTVIGLVAGLWWAV